MTSKLRTGAIALASLLLIVPSVSSTSFAQGHGRGHHGGGGGGGAVVRGGGGGGGGGAIRMAPSGGGGMQFNRGTTYSAPSFNRGYVAPNYVQHRNVYSRNFYYGNNYYYPRHRYRHRYGYYSPFLFLGGPRYYVRSYGPGWCRGLHRGRHWAPRIGWHAGLHRGLFRCY